MEGRNVSRGIGSGAAQIYSQTQNAVNTYARTLAQQQAKREAEQKALQDDLSKVKIDGIRQGDIPEFNAKYNEAKDIYAKLSATRNNAEKIQLDRDFKTRMLELNQIAQDSKALAKGENEFSKILLNPNIRDRYTPDAVERFQRAKPLSRNDPNYIRDLTKLEQQVDLSEVMKTFDTVDKKIIDYSQWDNPVQTPYKRGNEEGIMFQGSRTIDPRKQAMEYGMLIDTDNGKIRTALRKMFPQYAELPLEEFKAAVIPELVKQRVKTEYGEPKFIPKDDWKEKVDYKEVLIRNRPSKSGDDAEGNVGNVEVNKKLYGRGGKDAQGIIRKGEFESINFDYFIKPTDKNYASTQLTNVLNIRTGKNETMDADTNVALVGLGYTKAKGGKLIPKALIVNSEKDQYVVNESDLPITVTKSDEYKAAKRKLDQAYQSGGQPKAPTQSKKYSATQEKLISDNLKANPAYTREEIIQALGL